MAAGFPETCGKTVFTEQELFEGFQCDGYEMLYARVKEHEGQGRLAAVKASGRNGRTPSLYNRYRVIRQVKKDDSHSSEVTALHPSLHIEGYLADPRRFEAHRALLLPISDALRKRPDLFGARMSMNEKSFLLYGEEKLIVRERRKLETILAFNGLSLPDFGAYDTPEPFFCWNLDGVFNTGIQPDFSVSPVMKVRADSFPGLGSPVSVPAGPRPPGPGSILVLENKDIWYTLVDLARVMHLSSLFPELVVCLVYGEGNKVCREQGSFAGFLDQAYPAFASGRIWYAGDIDSEGVRIWQRLCRNNPGLSLHLHKPIYQAMYSWAGQVRNGSLFHLPDTEDERGAPKLSEAEWQAFLSESGADIVYQPADMTCLAQALAKGGRIPQEVANRMVLMDLLQEEAASREESGLA